MKLHSLEDRGDKNDYIDFLNSLLARQKEIKEQSIDLQSLYRCEQEKKKQAFIRDVGFPEYASLIAEFYVSRKKNLESLVKKYGENKVCSIICNEILNKIKISKHEEDVAELLWCLGEFGKKRNIKFIFNYLLKHYVNDNKFKGADTIIQAIKAIYKIAKHKKDYTLKRHEYLVLCKNAVEKSKNAILWTLRLINILDIPADIKKNLHARLDQNKLYFKSKPEFDRLLQKTSEGELEEDKISLTHKENLVEIANEIQSFPIQIDCSQFAAVRKKYPRAYEPWKSKKRTEKEDDLLVQAFSLCKKINDIAKIFQRQPTAIRSRVNKLGVIEKTVEISE